MLPKVRQPRRVLTGCRRREVCQNCLVSWGAVTHTAHIMHAHTDTPRRIARVHGLATASESTMNTKEDVAAATHDVDAFKPDTQNRPSPFFEDPQEVRVATTPFLALHTTTTTHRPHQKCVLRACIQQLIRLIRAHGRNSTIRALLTTVRMLSVLFFRAHPRS